MTNQDEARAEDGPSATCPLCTIIHRLGETIDVQVITAYVFGMHGADLEDDMLCAFHAPIVAELYEAMHDLRIALHKALAAGAGEMTS